MTGPIHRRRLLSLGGGLSILGATAPFAAQLAAAGSAASQAAVPDYRALVCIFLYGGNDSNSTIIETEANSFTRYTNARGGADPIALKKPGTEPNPGAAAGSPDRLGGVLPLSLLNAASPQLALHPSLRPLLPIFTEQRLAILANVGTLNEPLTKGGLLGSPRSYPKNLFSHNDQQSTWQAGASEGASVGWGGRLGDLFFDTNQRSLFTAMSTAGNAVFLSGRDVIQYQMNSEGQPAIAVNGASGMLFGAAAPTASVRNIIQARSTASIFGDDYTAVTRRSMDAAETLNRLFRDYGAAVSQPAPFTNPITQGVARNPVSEQLYTIARMIAAGKASGLKRQVFFVGVGGWDSHDHQNVAQTLNLARLAHGMAYFDTVLGSLGGQNMRPNVTTFTASDFSRSFTSNGDGTDHAWGGHHFIMGGSVIGNRLYGKFPTLGVDSATFENPDMIGGVLVPTTSVDQYAATMGRWLGASEAELNTIFPNLRNFSHLPGLGFMRPA